MHSALCLVFACKICKKCKITSQSRIDGKSIPPPLEGASSICVSRPIVLTGSGSLSSTAKRLCD